MVKNLPVMGFNPWLEKIPWRREWLPTPVFLPGEFHGQRSLAAVHRVIESPAELSNKSRIYLLRTCYASSTMVEKGC